MDSNFTDSFVRIGPRKLRRVLQCQVDSTATPSPSMSRSYDNRYYTAKPTTIEGPVSTSQPIVGEPTSYFELPRDGRRRSPSSLITPISFMNASTKSPGTPSSSNQHSDISVERRPSGSERHGGDTVLLVEDNVINMRVSLLVIVAAPELLGDTIRSRPIYTVSTL